MKNSCHCGECEAENNFYECDRCKESIPYCIGADDAHFNYCDSCAEQLKSNLRASLREKFSDQELAVATQGLRIPSFSYGREDLIELLSDHFVFLEEILS